MDTLMIEMGYDHDRMPEPIVTLPTLATDDECYPVRATKAVAGNKLPTQVMDTALYEALLGSVEIEVEHPTALQVVEKTFKVAHGLTAQPLAKRASIPDPFEGKKVPSVERDGKLKITKFEGGELLEIVED
jgi:hypothetical protein